MQKITVLSLLSLLGFFFFVTPLCGQDIENGSLKGKITDGHGEPLVGVIISIAEISKSAVSDKKGEYQLYDLVPGTYEVSANSIGFEKKILQATVLGGSTTFFDIQLETSYTRLADVYIRGEGLKVQNRAITVHSVSNADIKRLHLAKMDRVIEEVPGLVTNANPGGVASAIAMRGFGNGGHGGDIAVQVDGVSLNESEGHDDGYADLNMVIPLNLSRVDVYKGPSSVFFGNFAKAGAIALTSRKGGEYQDLVLQGGSFDSFDGQVALGNPFRLSNGKVLKTNFAAQMMRTNGFTKNSGYLKANVSGRIAYDFSDKSELALTLNGHSSDWNSTGFIPESQLSGPNWKEPGPEGNNDGGNKTFASERLDFNHSFNDNLRLLVYGYSVQQRYTEFFTFFGEQGEEYNNRKAYATGFNFNGKNNMGTVGLDWVAGFDFYNEFTGKKFWETENRVRKDLDEEADVRIQTTSFFAQADFTISPYFRPSLAVRYDDFGGSLKDRTQSPSELSRKLVGQNHVSPKLGFRSTWFRGFDFRFSATNGFSLPSGISRFDPSMDVDPVEIWQYEVGLSYDYDWVAADVSAYILNSSSEIHEIPPGSRQFENAGKTQRKGIELGLKLFPVRGLRFDGAFAYVDAKVKDNPEDPDLIGKKVRAIPQTITHIALEYALPVGVGVRYKLKDVGKYAIDTKNLSFYKGYTISDAEIFYNIKISNTRNARIYAQLNNVFDKRYAISYFSLGSSMVRPGAPRSFMIGVNYSL